MTSPHTFELPALSEAAERELRGALRGELVLPGDAAYEEARSVWNGMIDRRPALSCAAPPRMTWSRRSNFARAAASSWWRCACGAHSTPGYSTCDGGIVIDLRR